MLGLLGIRGLLKLCGCMKFIRHSKFFGSLQLFEGLRFIGGNRDGIALERGPQGVTCGTGQACLKRMICFLEAFLNMEWRG